MIFGWLRLLAAISIFIGISQLRFEPRSQQQKLSSRFGGMFLLGCSGKFMGFFEIQGKKGFSRVDAATLSSDRQNHEFGKIGTAPRALSSTPKFSPAHRAT
jgi:hypothetical protein